MWPVYSFATWQEIYPNLIASITGNLIECRSGATKIYKIHAGPTNLRVSFWRTQTKPLVETVRAKTKF